MADYKVAGVKLSLSEYHELERYANTHNISVSALLKLFVGSLLTGEIEISKGELIMMVNHDEYAVSEELETPFGVKVDRKFEKLRERGYPESFISGMKEQILNGIDTQIDMLPRKFDARKLRDEYA